MSLQDELVKEKYEVIASEVKEFVTAHTFPLQKETQKLFEIADENLTMNKTMQNANEEFYSIYKQTIQKY